MISKKSLKIIKWSAVIIGVGLYVSIFFAPPRWLIPYYFVIWSLSIMVLPLSRLNDNPTKSKKAAYAIVNILSISTIVIFAILNHMKDNTGLLLIELSFYLVQIGANGLVVKCVFYGRGDKSVLEGKPCTIFFNILIITIGLGLLCAVVFSQ